jgi:hypothetical protein
VTHANQEAGSTELPANVPAAPRSLARRVSGWTSNLLATGIVLAAAVGVGRQLTLWWRVDPDHGAAAAMPVGPGAMGERGEQPFQLTIGGGYSLRRFEVNGDLAAAIEQLRAHCRKIAASGPVPAQPPSQSERRFLSRTLNRTPLEEHPGAWQIHQFEGQLPLLVVVADSLRESTAPSSIGQPIEAPAVSPTPSTRGVSRLHHPRVVAWGLAMPTDEEACTLLVYEAGQEATRDRPAGEEFSLPAGLRRTLTLRGQGETSIGLAGEISPRLASRELDQFLSSRGWTSAGWRQIGAAWHNRYRGTGPSAPSVNVQLSDDGRGGLLGLIVVADL